MKSHHRWVTALLVCLVLGLYGWMALSATRDESTTVDELPHLTAGHALWAKGDYRLQPENGNLPQRWEGLPGWLEHRRFPPRDNAGWTQPNVWTLGHAYFYDGGNDVRSLLFQGRAMNLLWGVATAILVFLWSRSLLGAPAAWTSLAFFAFSPAMLAHGALATSDMCITFFMLASAGAYWRHLDDFRFGTLLTSAAVLALAFVAKYSAVLLVPVLGILAFIRLAGHRPMTFHGDRIEKRRGRLPLILGSAMIHVAVVGIVIWTFHGFRYLPSSDPALVNDYTRRWSEVLATVGNPWSGMLSWARTVHILPDAYLYGFAFVLDLSHARGAFLNGQTSLTGWIGYFPYTFLVKTPLAELLGCAGVAAIVAVRWRERPGASAELGAGGRRPGMAADLYRLAPLLALFAVYWAFSLASHLNIGERHLLPTYPVVFIGMGALGWAAARWRGPWRWLAAALVAGQVAASVAVRPHYLAYFNELAGGPEEGYRHLVDSSLDWGQDLPGLARWLQAHDLDRGPTPVYLAYFGTGDPAYYGIRATQMVPLLWIPAAEPWYRLRGGVYCISATLLSQAYSPIRGPWTASREEEYQDLRAVEPALLDYARYPAHRTGWEAQVAPAAWRKLWVRFEQMRFSRLCMYLHRRRPDAQIGYSINVYRLDDAELQSAVRSRWTATAPENRRS